MENSKKKNKTLLISAFILIFGCIGIWASTLHQSNEVTADREVLKNNAENTRTTILKDLGINDNQVAVDSSRDKERSADNATGNNGKEEDSNSDGVIITNDEDSSQKNTTQATNNNGGTLPTNTDSETDENGFDIVNMDTVGLSKTNPLTEKNHNTINDSIKLPSQKEIADFNKTDQYEEILNSRNTIISVPSANIYLPLYSKLDNQHLNVGAATYNGAYKPSNANSIILGHNIEVTDSLFSNLPNVKKGSRVYIYKNKQRYSYAITSIEIVNYAKSDVFSKTYTSGNRLTLITCLGQSKDPDKRVIITALATLYN